MVECRVEFDYDAAQDDELTIRPGDIIKNVQQQDGGWWEGELNGKRGVFPDNFVKLVKADPSKKAASKSAKDTTGRKTITNTTDDFKVMAANHNEPEVGVKSGHVRELQSVLSKQGSLQGPGKRETRRKRMCRVRALQAYTGEEEDELSFEVGDLIDVTEKDNENWWRGHLVNKDHVGAFPVKYVEVLEEGSESDNQEPAEIQPKKVKGVGLGDIFKNEPIKLRTANHKDDRDTVKPAHTPDDSVPLPPKPIKPRTSIIKETKEYARVLFPYDAANEDELSLKEGEQILIVDKEIEDEGWWKGEINGRQGVFPNNFVELIESKPKRPGPPSVKKAADRPLPADPKLEKVVTPKEERPPPLPNKKPEIPPPPVSKKPGPTKTLTPTDDVSADFDSISNQEPLRRINRPKGPAKRPPSRDLLKHENGEDSDAVDLPWLNDSSKQSVANNALRIDNDKFQTKGDDAAKRGPPLPPPPKTEAKSTAVIDTTSSLEFASNQKSIDALRSELHELKSMTVSRLQYDALKAEVGELREQMQAMKKHFDKKVNSLMDEIDEEKRLRLSAQVEMERVKKLAVASMSAGEA